MKPGLSGFVCVRNAVLYDYPIAECVKSLIPVCDEVVISYGGITNEDDDGTWDIIESLVAMDSRVRVTWYDWPNPERDIHWWTTWLNHARERLRYDTMLGLDADEVLDPAGYDQIDAMTSTGCSAMFHRLNFWRDPQHLVPENRACGTQVARLGPTSLYMPSDEPNPAVHPNVRTNATPFPSLRIFHYGFLRDPKAFVRKSIAVQGMFFGSCDPRITEMDAAGKDWREREYFDGLSLQEYNGYHPEVARKWLLERGYSL